MDSASVLATDRVALNVGDRGEAKHPPQGMEIQEEQEGGVVILMQ